MTSRYDPLAEFLADRYLSVQATKTAAGPSHSVWDTLRPENPDRPGANWWTGLGTGAMAGGAELGIGRYGLTDTVRRSLDRATLVSDPFARIHHPDFRAALADDEATRFLTDLFRRHEHTVGGKARVGNLFRRHYGELDIGNTTKMNQVRSGLQGLIDPNDTGMLRRWNDMTTTHVASGERVKKILDRMTQGNSPNMQLTDHERNLLTKFRTSIGKTDSAAQWDELQKGLRNLAASVKGGKKGAPVGAIFSDRTQQILNRLAASQAIGHGVDDTAKINRLLQSFGQFTKGRPVPSVWRRLGRAGSAAGIATGLGAYTLPSAVNFGKWLFGSPSGKGVSR